MFETKEEAVNELLFISKALVGINKEQTKVDIIIAIDRSFFID
jgi:hypothetical protein